MEELYKELQARAKHLEKKQQTEVIKGRLAENTLMTIRVQQILLADIKKKEEPVWHDGVVTDYNFSVIKEKQSKTKYLFKIIEYIIVFIISLNIGYILGKICVFIIAWLGIVPYLEKILSWVIIW